jgi:CDP-diacylglycerol--glycerol-3-phosphate 3-phosphatidyltransferase
MNIPTSITLARIALIPVLVVAFYVPGAWSDPLCAGVFVAAAVTDWLDGYLARRLNQTSSFGAFLDPVADKLMVAVALVLLVEANPQPWVAIPSAVIIGREIAISALREWMATIGQSQRVAVVMLGKLKTTAQLCAIALMLYVEPIAGLPSYEIGLGLLYLATILTLWSMVGYLRAAVPLIDLADSVVVTPAESGAKTPPDAENKPTKGKN